MALTIHNKNQIEHKAYVTSKSLKILQTQTVENKLKKKNKREIKNKYLTWDISVVLKRKKACPERKFRHCYQKDYCHLKLIQ